MRSVVLLAVAFFALPFTVQAQESPTADRPAVVAACARETVLPEGRTADATTVTAYCRCAIDHIAAALTPAEFHLFGRVGLARAGMGPQPSREEAAGIDAAELNRKAAIARATVQVECSPILFGPRD